MNTAQITANLLRATFQAAREDLNATGRWQRASKELSLYLASRADAIESPLSWYSDLCARFGIDPTSAAGGRHVEVFEPTGEGKGVHHPWILIVPKIKAEELRAALRLNPAFFAQFATMYVAPETRDQVLNDPEVFAAFDGVAEPAGHPIDLSGLRYPPRWRAVHTLLSPLAHGADSKTGNTAGFRREPRLDALTGLSSEIPFVSGASVRGQLRDRIVDDLLRRIDLKARACNPDVIHALYAGGSIDAGETVKAMPRLRAQLRDLCPLIDLLGGTYHGQLMEGALVVGDMILVCRETAWLAAPLMGEDPAELAKKLPPVSTCTTLRQGTRRHHADLPQEEGEKTLQMLFQTEVIAAGHRMVHSFTLRDHANASELQKSMLAHTLELLREHGMVGAKNNVSFGELSLGKYDGPPLAAPQVYLDHVEAHRTDLRTWLLQGGAFLGLVSAETTEKKGSGRPRKTKAEAAKAEETKPEAEPADESDARRLF